MRKQTSSLVIKWSIYSAIILVVVTILALLGCLTYAETVADPMGWGRSVSDIAFPLVYIVLVSAFIGVVILIVTLIYWAIRHRLNPQLGSKYREKRAIKLTLILLPLVFYLLTFLAMIIFLSKEPAPPQLKPLSLFLSFSKGKIVGNCKNHPFGIE